MNIEEFIPIKKEESEINQMSPLVWAYVGDFLHYYGCKSNPLYECGFNRIGCIGCPVAGKHRYVEFERYPKYKQNYINAFDRMLERRKQLGKDAGMSWQTGQDVFRWWLGEDFNQLTFDDLEG